ncbi:MAG: phosphotransferase [Burkholderiaceae bacterium]
MTDKNETFTGTMPIAERQRFDVGALDAYLRQHLDGYQGPLTVEQFKGGQSNPTFVLRTPSRAYVMRSKPGPVAKLLPSAHAIEREYRVMHALSKTEVPVAKVYCLCADESIIGRAFYVMEFIEGRILWEQALPGMSAAERGAIYDEMNRVMALLHTTDYQAIGLGDFGRPGNYFSRQIGRWSKQYAVSETQKIDEMDRLIEWLPAHIPAGDETTIVHGDYRLDNLVFDAKQPRIRAILDWELSTLGHPLADFSYHCMGFHIEPEQFRGIKGLDLAALGIPSERQYIDAYCRRTGRAGVEHWDFYLAYNLFRLAAILQGIAKRVVDGTASNERAHEQAARVVPLAKAGWAIAQRVG